MVRIYDIGVAREFGLDVGVDGLITRGSIIHCFIGAVLQAKCDNLLSDVIPQR